MAVRYWHIYLAGTEFVIKSDHNPLVHLRETKNSKGKFARWITELEEYRYTVEYLPGKQNIKADDLSRNENATDFDNIEEFEDKIYTISILTDSNFQEQLKYEQLNDYVISNARLDIENGRKLTKGKLRRLNKQLRIENEVLTKSGRPIIPSSLHFGSQKIYELIRKRYYWPDM